MLVVITLVPHQITKDWFSPRRVLKSYCTWLNVNLLDRVKIPASFLNDRSFQVEGETH